VKENHSLPLKIILLSAGVFFGLFIGVLFAALLLISRVEEKSMSYFELVSLVINVFVVAAAIVAIIFSWASLRRQKNQWLNESFIRYEADTLMELRNKFAVSSRAVHFFINEILVIEKKYGYITQAPPVIKYACVAKNFNILLELNDLYNYHQQIFRKHELEKSIECIALILESVRNIPERDIQYELISQSANSQTYRMEPAVLETVVMSFNWLAHSLYDYEPGSSPSIEQLNLQCEKDQLNELARFRELTGQRLISLMYDLDMLTMYLEPKSSPALQGRSMRYFERKNES